MTGTHPALASPREVTTWPGHTVPITGLPVPGPLRTLTAAVATMGVGRAWAKGPTTSYDDLTRKYDAHQGGGLGSAAAG